MTSSILQELEYVYQRRHKLDFETLRDAPSFVFNTLLSNIVFGELNRQEMQDAYPTWRYGSEGTLDTSFLKHTQDERRGITYEETQGWITMEQPFVSRICGEDINPRFIGQHTPLSLTPDGKIVREIAKNNRSQINALLENVMPFDWLTEYLRLRLDRNSSPSHLDGDVLPLFQRKYPNYYHWMMDEVPKLRAIEHYPDSVTIGLEQDPPSYVVESLDLLDFSNYVQITETPTTADGILAVINRNPEFINISYVEDSYISWLRERVRNNIEPSGLNERIIISREESGARRIVNRDKLVKRLGEMGFRSYKLQERSFEENVRLFTDAEIVVSPHGAGLTDIIFSEDASVVELSTLSSPPPAFYLLAQQAGHDYRHITCRAANEAKYDVQENMIVDVDRVIATVESLLR